MSQSEDFFLRYYIGHKGAYGHQYLDFEVDAKGKLKYLNNSQYKSDSLISKQAYVSQTVIQQLKNIIKQSDILSYNDKKWPKPDKIGNQQASFKTSKIGSSVEVQKTQDPQGLNIQNVLFSHQLICILGSNLSET